jgi:hypothetical protein
MLVRKREMQAGFRPSSWETNLILSFLPEEHNIMIPAYKYKVCLRQRKVIRPFLATQSVLTGQVIFLKLFLVSWQLEAETDYSMDD